MTTDAQAFRKRRRAKVKLAEDGDTFIVRPLDVFDILLAGGNPDVLKLAEGTPEQRLKQLGTQVEKMLEDILSDVERNKEFMKKIIVMGAIEPQVSMEAQPEASKVICIDEFIYDELDRLAGGILKFSGLTKAEGNKLPPLLTRGASSSPSISSPDDTESSPLKSSESTTPSSPGPSTSEPVSGE